MAKKYDVQYFVNLEDGDNYIENFSLTIDEIETLQADFVKYDGFVIKYKGDWKEFSVENKKIVIH